MFTIKITLFLIFLATGAVLSGQEEKKEQHVKIIAVDKTGGKIEIDTLIKNGTMMDTIVLKDGKIIVIGSHDSKGGIIAHTGEGKGQIYLTISSDENTAKGEKGEKSAEKKIVIISDGNGPVVQKGESGNVFIMERANISGEKGEKTVTWSSSEGGSKGESHYYISGGKDIVKNGEKTYNVKVITDEEGNSVEKTKYVIAKNGMVITIEGDDEAKVKEMIKEVESKLGVVKEDNNKTVVKQDTKKTKNK